jgi:hypothetical protein
MAAAAALAAILARTIRAATSGPAAHPARRAAQSRPGRATATWTTTSRSERERETLPTSILPAQGNIESANTRHEPCAAARSSSRDPASCVHGHGRVRAWHRPVCRAEPHRFRLSTGSRGTHSERPFRSRRAERHRPRKSLEKRREKPVARTGQGVVWRASMRYMILSKT